MTMMAQRPNGVPLAMLVLFALIIQSKKRPGSGTHMSPRKP